MLNTSPSGIDRLRATTERIRRDQKHAETLEKISTLKLPDLLKLEEEFLQWYAKTTHPDREEKLRIYNEYMIPRIKLLTNVEAAEQIFLGKKPEARGTQLKLTG